MPKRVVWKTETGDTDTQPPGQTGPNRFANKHVYIVPGTSTYEQMAQKGREILAARRSRNKTPQERALYGMATTGVNTLVVTNDMDLQEMEAHIIKLCGATTGNPKHIEVPVQGVVVTSRHSARQRCDSLRGVENAASTTAPEAMRRASRVNGAAADGATWRYG